MMDHAPVRSHDLLNVSDLTIAFGSPECPARAVTAASFAVRSGEILGIVGESGSGKSTLCAGLIRALPAAARISGRVEFEGRDLYRLGPSELRALRGRMIGFVPQNTMTSLDPLFTIGSQIGEVLHHRHGVPRRDTKRQAASVLRRMHLTAPEHRVRQFPHQVSGGMKQRILIGMATAGAPKLLVADEPTTALDATIQEEILLLFREIRDRFGTAVIVVTHDLGVVRRLCDRVLVMYAGSIVEEGPVATVFARPAHPYTQGLLASLPRLEGDRITLRPIPGQVPKLTELGPGCAFATRCASALDICSGEAPPVIPIAARHATRCWRAEQLS